jgi:hypothetical protein
MAEKFLDIAIAQAKAASPDAYFKLQVRVWTRFDPTKSELIDIVRAVEAGDAFVSALEVTRVARGIHDIDDVDVREQFENLAAVERIVRKLDELPAAVLDKLRTALVKGESRERVAG